MAHFFPQPKGAPKVIARYRKRVTEQSALKAAYADVDARDAGYCYVTGRYTVAGHVDPRMRREHHHLVKRSQDSTKVSDPNNIITVCAEAHRLIEAGWIVVEGTDARRPLFFHYAEFVEAKDKPFPITARRMRRAE